MTSGGRETGSSREDALLPVFCKRVTEQLAARFGAGRELTAAEDRLRAWMQRRISDDKARREAPAASSSEALPASSGVAGAAAVTAGFSEAGIAVGAARVADARQGRARAGFPEPGTEHTVTALYETHYRSLVRLAALLVRDVPTAERIVQDSFVALHQRWRGQGADIAVSSLRQSVIHRSRSALRQRVAAGQDAPRPAPGRPSRDERLLATALDRPAIISALGRLPARQREAMVLRYYADLTEAQVASTMGISRGAAARHISRAMAALHWVLDSPGE
jgi:RNA polymerase sigma factor (sigma-70 family)